MCTNKTEEFNDERIPTWWTVQMRVSGLQCLGAREIVTRGHSGGGRIVGSLCRYTKKKGEIYEKYGGLLESKKNENRGSARVVSR